MSRWFLSHGFAALALTVIASSAHATKVLLVTDQAKAVKAREVAALFTSTEPFSRMRNLEFKVIQTNARRLGCNVRPASLGEEKMFSALSEEDALAKMESLDRLALLQESTKSLEGENSNASKALPPSCNEKDGSVPTRLISCSSATTKSYIQGLLKSEKAAFAIIVKDEPRYGGSGGETPVITTGSPASMAIHEFMHRLGFADEYGYYNSCEADIYCDQQASDVIAKSGYGFLPGTSFNVALFNAREAYSSNSDVRRTHGSKLPWLSSIASSTNLLTNSKLGTPTSNVIGIYRAIVCDKASRKLETWQSTSEPTIMKTLGTTHIPKPYWAPLAKSLGVTLTPKSLETESAE